MNSPIQAVLREHSSHLDPIPTGIKPRLERIEDIRAVLFDVYGTMFVSASGEVGTAGAIDQSQAVGQAMSAVGISCLDSETCVQTLRQTILAHHERRRSDGITSPEVEIVQVWQDALDHMQRRNAVRLPDRANVNHRMLATEYETRVNRVWPMPGVLESLGRLRRANMLLGIVSNAQFYTIELFPALLNQTLSDVGFDNRLQYYSFRFLHAKPSTFLFEQARHELDQRGIAPSHVLYVGNDLLNDIMPAQSVGFRAALFGGDARSLRMRDGDQRIEGVVPDLVLTDLRQIPDCMVPEK